MIWTKTHFPLRRQGVAAAGGGSPGLWRRIEVQQRSSETMVQPLLLTRSPFST